MKRKFSLMWRGAMVLVMVLTLGLVMATPAAASPDLTEVEITVSPPTATATAIYTVDFFLHTGLTDEVNCFVIEFPAGTTVPPTIATASVEIYDMTVPAGPQVPSSVAVVGQVVYVYMPGAGPGIMAFHYGRVVFKLVAGIQNPPATDVETFTAWIYSDEEPTPVPVSYDIFETVPIDVFLKYQIPPADCGYIEDILVDTFITIGDALVFVEKLYTSGTSAEFTVDGAVSLWDYGDFGVTTASVWTDLGPIGDLLGATDVIATDTADETFTVTYNLNDGTSASQILTIDTGSGSTWSTAAPAGVVDVVSVTGGDPGATAGYQNKFNLTGDAYNDTAGDYGNFGITAAGTFTDGTSIGEALTVTVTPPTTNPETYTVTYFKDDASGIHYASLTILIDGTKIWSPAGVPANVVDIDFAIPTATTAWDWYAECPDPEGGLIGARVLVANGIYAETITIGTPGVMVESVNGAAFTTIDATNLTPAGPAASMHIAAVMIAAEGVTFGGTGKGFTVKNAGVGVDAGGIGAASTLYADDNSDGIADVSGVYIWPNGGTHTPQATPLSHWCRVSVIGNTIYGSQARGIRADASTGTYGYAGVSVYIAENTVYNNLFEGFSGDDLTFGPTWLDPGYLEPTTPFWGYTAIVDNEFFQNGPSGMGTWEYEGQFTTVPGGWKDAGIEIGSTISEPTTCYIVGNDVHDNVHAGINLLEDAAIDALIIEENRIYDNGIFGIANSATTNNGIPPAINVTCRYNDIYGNGYWGIKNFVSTNFVAKANYWGALGGPSRGPAPIRHEDDQRSDALGNGNAVSDYVVYEPWLTKLQATVVASGVRSYGSDAIELQAGWNTLSVPCGLKSTGDTFGDIQAMGDYLTDFVNGYWYDAAVPQWKGVSSATTLEAGKGFYILMSAASRFPVLYYDGLLDLPAYGMSAGWNLIGSMFGIDKTAAMIPTDEGDFGVATLDADTDNDPIILFDDIESYMDKDVALNSIGADCSVVMSPSLPGQLVMWSEVYDGIVITGNVMVVGEAYWVFMTADGILAGFEVTPFYFTLP